MLTPLLFAMCICIVKALLQDICFSRSKISKVWNFLWHINIAYLQSILWCWARLINWNHLQVQYVASYHGYHIFVRFFFGDAIALSRKPYVSVKTFLCFFHQFNLAYVSQAQCIGLFLLCPFWYHMILIYCLCVSQLTVLHVPIVWLSSGKTMILVLHVDLISCQYF